MSRSAPFHEASVIAFAALAALSGCSGNKQTYPALASEDCIVPPCQAGIDVTGGPSGGGSTGIFDGGTVALGGIVDVFTDADFVQTSPFSGSGTIGVFGPAGPPNQASATFNGSTYEIDGAPVSSVLWADLQTTSTTLMPTLIAIASDSTAATAVAFAQTSAMTQIFSDLSHTPQTLQTDRAQLVMKFVSSSGAPLSGVTITLTPQGADVAYDAGADYSDLPQSAATGSRGIALVLNANAVAWPGALAAITFKYGTPAVAGTLDAYIAQGAVTVVTVAPGQ